MFTSIKRVLIATTMILAITVPSAAYARFDLGPPAGSSTANHAQPAGVVHRPASGGGSSTGAPEVHRTAPSAQSGFQWLDAGIGAAGVLGLVAAGAGATLVIRRRVRQPLTS